VKNKYLKIVLFFIGLVALAGAIFIFENIEEPKLPVPQEAPAIQPESSENTPNKEIAKPEETPAIPDSYDLKVPFVSQAPYANWDELHNEACEEAAIILVHFYKTKKTLTKEIMEQEIQKMVAYEIKNYGSHKDLTTAETAKLAKQFYGYKNVSVKYDFSWNDVKKEIAEGKPVIVPAAGRLLKNPNFRQPGPIYHMLVIRGYTHSIIITNDIGTRKGERYQYSYQTLDSVIHDWNGNPETITKGRRAMLVIED